MTEITAKTIRREVYVIDPVAFFLALFGAPLAVAVGGFWALGIPVFALVMGGPVYLALGTPVLLWHLGRHPPETGRIAGLALATHLAASAVALCCVAVLEGPDAARGLAVLVGFGVVFALAWGAVFAIFYRKFRRAIYARPI